MLQTPLFCQLADGQSVVAAWTLDRTNFYSDALAKVEWPKIYLNGRSSFCIVTLRGTIYSKRACDTRSLFVDHFYYTYFYKELDCDKNIDEFCFLAILAKVNGK